MDERRGKKELRAERRHLILKQIIKGKQESAAKETR